MNMVVQNKIINSHNDGVMRICEMMTDDDDDDDDDDDN